MESRQVVVMGLGVVGLPSALMLAKGGYRVFGVDINKRIINWLKNGFLPPQVQESQLQLILKDPRVKKNLHFQQTPTPADTFIITVPTPLDPTGRKADLSFVKNATEAIIPFLKKGVLVIVESTVPPKTCRNFISPILEKSGLKVGKDISLAHCPERVLPGNIYHEIIYNDRIIGGVDEKSSKLAEKIYKSFVKGNIYRTDDVSAEFCKLMENAYRDVNIALANEFAQVAKNLGVDPKNVITLANYHPRVNILKYGIGVGGHCIPIDPWFIYQVDPLNSKLISTARKINNHMPIKVAKMIKKELKHIKNPKIVVIGASYKTDSTDTRESPAIEIVKILKTRGVDVAHFDPLVDGFKYQKNLLDECMDKDLLVILVPHEVVLKELNKDIKKIQAVLSTHKILQF